MRTAIFAAVVALSTACSSTTREERQAAALRERSSYCDERAQQALEEIRADVQSVGPLVIVRKNSKQTFGSELVGARVSFRAVKGVTQQWLERALQCHQAQLTLDPSSAKSADTDPFWLPDGWVDIEVRAVNGGFVAELRGSNDEDAKRIYARALELMAHHTASN
jgi:hypothetical protein